jgi:hypothetical protein
MSWSAIVPAKLQRLIKALNECEIDSDLKRYNCMGIIDKVPNKRLTDSINSGRLTMEEIESESRDQCYCGSDIERLCFIQHQETNRLLCIGICCYKGMTNPEDRMLKCIECKEPHRNRTTNLCSPCRERSKIEAKTIRAQETRNRNEAKRKAHKDAMAFRRKERTYLGISLKAYKQLEADRASLVEVDWDIMKRAIMNTPNWKMRIEEKKAFEDEELKTLGQSLVTWPEYRGWRVSVVCLVNPRYALNQPWNAYVDAYLNGSNGSW